jgi:hypothetical protein
MSSLAALQARFLAGLLADDGRAAADLRDTPQFAVGQRLAVYANAYRRRLVEALAAVHERCAAVLGEDAFDALALAYVEAHPPNDRALGRYGVDFPDWLRARDASLAVAADIARIDAGLRRAFDAEDVAAQPREALLALAPAQWAALRLRFVPALSVGVIDPRAIAAWRGADAAIAPTPTPAPVAGVAPRVAVAFWRHDEQTLFRSLADDEATLLGRLRDGTALAEACFADASAPIAVDRAAALLLAWVDEGWVAALPLE